MTTDGTVDRPRHVLVVERDMIVGMSLAEDLADHGFRVSGPFCSSREPLALLEADPPDAAIVDVGLRDGEGAEIARRIGARLIPVVLFSAETRGHHGSGLGAVPWIEKPASTARLLAALGLASAVREAPIAA